MHRVLQRQIQRYLGDLPSDPGWAAFVKAVSETYDHFDEHRLLTERSLELSSEELLEMNRRLEAEIATKEQLARELEAANLELKDFAYVVSHDLKAPLRGIASLASWLKTDYEDKLDEDGKEQLSMLVGRVSRLQNLIEGILEYSRIGRVKEKIEAVDLQELVSDLVLDLSPPQHIDIVIDGPLPVVNGEPTRVRQVFQNLISNAIKYNDKPQGTIRISSQAGAGESILRVQDNGPGIDPQYHQKVFQIFQTLQPRDHMESTGIGLSLVKKIVEGYGGRVYIESSPGGGATFVVHWPASITLGRLVEPLEAGVS